MQYYAKTGAPLEELRTFLEAFASDERRPVWGITLRIVLYGPSRCGMSHLIVSGIITPATKIKGVLRPK